LFIRLRAATKANSPSGGFICRVGVADAFRRLRRAVVPLICAQIKARRFTWRAAFCTRTEKQPTTTASQSARDRGPAVLPAISDTVTFAAASMRPLLTAAARRFCGEPWFAPSAGVLTRKDLEVVRGGLSPGGLLDELMQLLIGAALAQLSRYLFRNVTNPTFRG